MNVPQHWFAETVSVRTYTGQGAYGDVFADPVTVFGHLSGGRTVARSAQNEEVTSDVRLLLPNPARLVDGTGTVDPADLLRAQSRVTSGAQETTVVQVAEHRQPGTGHLVYVSASLV